MLVIACVCGILYGVQKLADNADMQPEIVVGYVAEDEKWTQKAIDYITELAAFQNWCRFEPVSEKVGLEAVESGEMTALLVIPQGMLQSILTGENLPATLYLSGRASQYQGLFETLGNMAVEMLQSAQIQVYATYGLLENGVNQELCNQLSAKIDMENLQFALERDVLFQHHLVQITGNESDTVYFGSIFFVFMACGFAFFVYGYASFSKEYCMFYQKRAGISAFMQVVLRLAGISMYALTGIVSILMLCGQMNQMGLCILLAISIASYAEFFILLSSKKQYLIILVTLSAFIQGYVTGCFVPDLFLTVKLKETAKFFPSYWWRKGIKNVLSGYADLENSMHLMLVFWTVLFLLGSMLIMIFREKTQEYKGREELHAIGWRNRLYQPAFFIYVKRMCIQPFFWLCMLLPLSGVKYVDHMEKQSDLGIYIGIVDEAKEWDNAFSKDAGMVHFEKFLSPEDMQKALLKGKISCGYILDKELKKDLLQKNITWRIPCYETEDKLLTAAANEIVFSKIFQEISTLKYWQTLKESGIVVAADILEKEYHTFSLQIEELEDFNFSDKKEAIPRSLFVMGFRVLGILVCAGYAICFLLEDKKKQRFYKRKKIGEKIFLVLFTTCLGLILQFLLT